MTPHAVDCECLGCEDARAGLTRTFYKGTVLSCNFDQAVVREEDGTEAIFHRRDDISVLTWKDMHPVGKEVTWSDTRETAH